MRAVMLNEFGPPEALVAADVPEPIAGDGQVLIDVEYANTTFIETQVRAGKPPRPEMRPLLPAILGGGVGGVVARAGPGVEAGVIGRRVVASLGGSGGYAERALTAASRLIDVPEGVTMRDAVALLSDGRTAIGLIRRADPQPGETVLVDAAAGGVGTLLVQLGRNAGARVIALAGGERKLGVAREVGAAIAADYRTPSWAERVRERAGAVDVVFDGVGGAVGEAAFELLGPGGRFCPFGMASGRWSERIGRVGYFELMAPRPASRSTRVMACLNGGRTPAEHPAVPQTPAELAADAVAVGRAGAFAVHVHPRDADGGQTLAARACDAAVAAIRAAAPRLQIGLSTSAAIDPDPFARAAAIPTWRRRPDFVSVNLSELGWGGIVRAANHAGIAVEAGLATAAEAEELARSPFSHLVIRALVEVERGADEARAVAALITAEVPQLWHGYGPRTWEVIAAAAERGSDIRVGLEDTLALPDGSEAPGNAELVAAAVDVIKGAG